MSHVFAYIDAYVSSFTMRHYDATWTLYSIVNM